MATEFVQTPKPAQNRSRSARLSLVLPIDLAGVRDKAGFLTKIAGKLDFPDYFGGNWDAVEECLADWFPAKARGCDVTLNVVNADQLCEADPSVLQTFSDIVNNIAELTRRDGCDLRFSVDK